MAVLIVLGVVLIHLISSSIYFAYLMFSHRELFAGKGPKAGVSVLEQLQSGEMFQLLAFDQGVFLLAVFTIAWLVFRKRLTRVIPFRVPTFRHVGLITLLILPLTVMDSFLVQMLIDVWKTLFGTSPWQGDLPTVLGGVTDETSTVMLLVILALAPALGEELVFRGVIGRGLIARQGLVAGVLWTSLLFSAVHGNPVQAVGVFFVGVMCHVSYLATRTILAPMLLHFLHNALPVLVLKHLAALKDQGTPEDLASRVPPLMAVAAAVCVVLLGCLLWKSRVQYLAADGAYLIDDIPTVEPPAEAEQERYRPVTRSWAAIAGVAYLLFLMSSRLAVPS